VYDGAGKRVIKCSGTFPTCASGTLYWTGAGSGTLDETNWTGQFLEEYIFFNGQRAARRDGVGNTVHYFFADQLGSADVVASATGTIEKSSVYYPFGGEIQVTGASVVNTYKFTGKERDAESGLDDFGVRFDASSLGRFMSPDQGSLSLGNPQSLNRYGFAFNNPLRFVDPDGNEVFELGSLVVTEYKNGEGGQDHSLADVIFAVFSAYGTRPETVKGTKYWEDKNGNAKGGMGPDPVRLPQAEHPAEGMGESGAWFAESDQNWTVSVDFEPGCGAPSASIQFNQHPETGFVKDGSKSGFSYRTESQPESVSSAIRFNSLAGLSGSKLLALYDQASKSIMDSNGGNANQYFEIMVAVLGEMGKREKKDKPKCSANGDFGPGHTNGGSPNLGPPTQTANGCKQ
jgi:RHS repeat-associated protein